MPIVPLGESQVQPAQLPNVGGRRAPPAPEVEGPYLALAHASKQIATAIHEQVNKADRAALNDADAQYDAWANDVIYGGQNGFLRRDGQEAVDAYETTLEALRVRREQIRESLSPRLQDVWDRDHAAPKTNTYQRDIQGHLGKAIDQVDKDTFLATKQAIKGRMALDPFSPARDMDELELARKAAVWGASRGVPTTVGPEGGPSPAERFAQQEVAEAVKIKVKAFLHAKDPEGALAYATSRRDTLGVDFLGVEQEIEKEMGSVQAYRAAAAASTVVLPDQPTEYPGRPQLVDTMGARGFLDALSKPAIRNPDGSYSTERTMTIEVGGQYYVVPTIVGGRELGIEEAADLWRKGQNPEVGRFATADQAQAFAEQRTAAIGRIRGPTGRALTPEELDAARRQLEDRQRQAQHAYTVWLGGISQRAQAAWENGDPARGVPAYSDPEIAVPYDLRRALTDPRNPGGAEHWHTLTEWYRRRVLGERSTPPSYAQVETLASLEQDMVRNREVYQRMPATVFTAMWKSIDPRTNEPRLTEQQYNDAYRLFLSIQKGAEGPQPRLVSDREILLNELQNAGIIPKSHGKGKIDPNAFTDATTQGAWWIEMTGELARWRRRNPDAQDDDVRAYIVPEIQKRKEEKWKEKSFKMGRPGTLTGPEYRRMRGVEQSEYERADVPVKGPPASVPSEAPQVRKIGDRAEGATIGKAPGTTWEWTQQGGQVGWKRVN